MVTLRLFSLCLVDNSVSAFFIPKREGMRKNKTVLETSCFDFIFLISKSIAWQVRAWLVTGQSLAKWQQRRVEDEYSDMWWETGGIWAWWDLELKGEYLGKRSILLYFNWTRTCVQSSKRLCYGNFCWKCQTVFMSASSS